MAKQTKTVKVHIPGDVYHLLQAHALIEQETLSTITTRALARWLPHQPGADTPLQTREEPTPT